jgi:Spy/CpxP family protein refolding chaperone
LTSISAFGATVRQSQPAAAPATIEDTLKAFRADLQGQRADVIAKDVTLTPEQAARFWPVFQTYQKEQSAIMDEQLRGIQQYVDSYRTLDDSAALALITAHLDRDAKMVALRQTWLAEFLKVLPAKLAVRVVQIDRRISLSQQLQFTSKIPLVE